VIAYTHTASGDISGWTTAVIESYCPSPQPKRRFLTEPQAWREIARRLERRGCEDGLCHEADELQHEDRIDWYVWDAMRSRIRAHMELMRPEPIVEVRPWYVAPFGPRRVEYQQEVPMYYEDEGVAGPRILAAYLLALEAEDAA
jgi:hypothetical protein